VVRIIPGQIRDARGIAQVYLEAFPDSAAFYFPNKPPERLVQAVKCGFELLFLLGAQATVALDSDGTVTGYCVFSAAAQSRPRQSWRKLVATGLRALGNLSAPELAKLVYGRILFRTHFRLKDKLPPEGGRIISIAVSTRYQGRGLGRKLLTQALSEIGPVPVLLEVRANNASARALYRSCGFRSYGTTRDGLGMWLVMARPAADGAKDPVSP
jgi:ribosomal protein S18 acetylase RimI-like enzyme